MKNSALALLRLGPVPSDHMPTTLDNSDQGHCYSMCHFPSHPMSLEIHELGSKDHTSPQRSFLGNSLYHSNNSATGATLGVGQSLT